MHSQINRVHHIITGLNDGGAEATLYRLCTVDSIHRHSIISLMDGGKYCRLLEKAGIQVVCLNMPRGRLTASGVWRLWRLLRTERPDVVQTWMYHADLIGGIVAKFAGVPRIIWGIHHTILEPGKSRRMTMLIARINAWLSHWVPTAIVCCAERAREVHQALGYDAYKMSVIPNGYDLQRFRPDEESRRRLRTEWGVIDAQFLIGMVGRFDPQKDHENLLRALAMLKRNVIPFRCVLVGRDMDTANSQLEAWLAEYKLVDEVLLLGQQSDIPAVMNALDLHVLSSSAEAFPNVLPEAMACGTPCITTDVGDAAYIVGDTGWVVAPGKSEELSKAIELASAEFFDPQPFAWRERCADARVRVAAHFNVGRMVEAYQTVWNA